MQSDLQDDFLCVAHVGESHHQDYLVPYIMRSKEKKILLFGSEADNTVIFFKKYPNTTIRYLQTHKNFEKNFTQDPEIMSKKMIIGSAYNSTLVNFQKSDDFYNIYVCHGVPQKLIGTKFYDWFWLFDTSIIHSHKDLKQILSHRNIKSVNIKPEQTSLFIEDQNKRKTLFIIGGNLKMRDYLINKPDQKQLLANYPQIDPSKKTILYTPTFDSLYWTKKKDLCSVKVFVNKILSKVKNFDDYNIIFKCHPGIARDDFLNSQLKALQDKHDNLIVDYRGNLQHYMQLADILFTDYTSATYDFLYFDKPILFIDKFNELNDGEPDIEDIDHRCWLYGAGHIINRNNVNNITEIIQSELKNDDFKEKRQIYKEISFDDTLDGTQILNLCRQHPKYDR